jgi:hypothetical protein
VKPSLLRITASAAVLLIVLFLGAKIQAQTTAFTYQGRFTDSSTNPPTTNGTYSMTFRLFDTDGTDPQNPGTLIATQAAAPVTVANGIFTPRIDFGAAAFNSTQNRFLEVQVGSIVLTPRHQLTSVPFSVMAKTAANASTATSGTTVSVASLTLVALNYASATAITDLTGGIEGQCVVLLANNGNVSIADSGNFKLSANWSPLGADTLTVCRSAITLAVAFWYETARSANNFFSHLQVIKNGSGSGNVTSVPAGINCGVDCSETYESETVVTLTAAAASNSTFSGWSGGGCSGTGTCTTTMDSAVKTVTATFTSNNFTLTVTKAGTGSGTVTSSPAGIDCGTECSGIYADGTRVTLTAVPSASSSFAGWSGACTGTGACVVNVTNAATVTATFTLITFTLTVTKEGTGGGNITSSPAGISCGMDCSEAYAPNTMVTVTAAPDSGSFFAGWGGSCSGTGNCTVTMNAAKTVNALFNLNATLTDQPPVVRLTPNRTQDK